MRSIDPNDVTTQEYPVVDSNTVAFSNVTPYGGGSDDSLVNFDDTVEVLIFIISVFGIGANVINTLVFSKHGFQEHSNIIFFTLSMSDLINVISSFVIFAVYVTDGLFPTLVLGLGEVKLLLMWLQEWMYITSTLIMVYVSLERSLIVLIPFTFRIFATRFKTVVILVAIITYSSAFYLTAISRLSFDWLWNAQLNRTRLTLVFTDDYFEVSEIIYVNFMVLIFSSQIIVTVATIVLVRGLTSSLKFRKAATSMDTGGMSGTYHKGTSKEENDSSCIGNTAVRYEERTPQRFPEATSAQSGSNTSTNAIPLRSSPVSTLHGEMFSKNNEKSSVKIEDKQLTATKSLRPSREVALIRTVQWLAAVFVVCNSPGVALAILLKVWKVSPTYFLEGWKLRVIHMLFGVVRLCYCLNASINIIIYASANRKFRRTLLQFLHCGKRGGMH